MPLIEISESPIIYGEDHFSETMRMLDSLNPDTAEIARSLLNYVYPKRVQTSTPIPFGDYTALMDNLNALQQKLGPSSDPLKAPRLLKRIQYYLQYALKLEELAYRHLRDDFVILEGWLQENSQLCLPGFPMSDFLKFVFKDGPSGSLLDIYMYIVSLRFEYVYWDRKLEAWSYHEECSSQMATLAPIIISVEQVLSRDPFFDIGEGSRSRSNVDIYDLIEETGKRYHTAYYLSLQVSQNLL